MQIDLSFDILGQTLQASADITITSCPRRGLGANDPNAQPLEFHVDEIFISQTIIGWIKGHRREQKVLHPCPGWLAMIISDSDELSSMIMAELEDEDDGDARYDSHMEQL